jgi:hypothetical protein
MTAVSDQGDARRTFTHRTAGGVLGPLLREVTVSDPPVLRA